MRHTHHKAANADPEGHGKARYQSNHCTLRREHRRGEQQREDRPEMKSTKAEQKTDDDSEETVLSMPFPSALFPCFPIAHIICGHNNKKIK